MKREFHITYYYEYSLYLLANTIERLSLYAKIGYSHLLLSFWSPTILSFPLNHQVKIRSNNTTAQQHSEYTQGLYPD